MTPPELSRPNPFIYLRILSVPLLWFFAWMDWQAALGIGIALSALTDVLDGRLAAVDRAYANARLDSFADKFLTVSVLLWLILLRPALFTDHALWVALAAATFAASILVSVIKYQRPTTLHLLSGKLGGLIQAVFVVHTFISGGYSPWLFYLAIGSFILAGLEEILVLLAYGDGEHLKSILPMLNKR